MEDNRIMYEEIIRIRSFEQKVLELFGKNLLSGTTHTYIGQEATAVAVMRFVAENDFVFSNHRCHGHYLAYGGSEEKLLAEIMSKESGLCKGRGGSQHIHYKNFISNGIQGGIVPNALGVAYANKYLGKKVNTVVFLGDGTLGQGVVYESFNLASVFSVPILFVIEDNQYAMSTRHKDVFAGDILSRIESFGITSYEISSTDVEELKIFFEKVFMDLNERKGPICAIVHNYRLGAHSKGDDTRDPNEIMKYRYNDPIELVRKKIGNDVFDSIVGRYSKKLDILVEKLQKESYLTIDNQRISVIGNPESFLPKENYKFVERENLAFRRILEGNNRVIMMGEDIRDPYGGAFKVTKGLTDMFDSQMVNMPISEAAMVGMGVGMSMSGIIPIVEIMFGDFITLVLDQLLNHASKYSWILADDQIKLPMIVRTPMGAKRGYGPTHSQSLEKLLVGIPGLRVLAMSLMCDPLTFYSSLVEKIDEPTVVIENKSLYGKKSNDITDRINELFSVREVNNYGYPSFVVSLDAETVPDCYFVVWGGMVEEAIDAAYELMMKYEYLVNVIVLTQLNPLPIDDLQKIFCAKVPIIVIEEETKTGGVGAEIVASCAERSFGKHYYRISTPDMPIPNGISLEKQIIPDIKKIVEMTREYLTQ